MLKETSGGMLKKFWLVSFAVLISAALILPAGGTSVQATSKGSEQKGAVALFDLNSATQKELEGIEGVGPATAKKIIAGRPYKSVDELSKAGLSKKTIDKLKPFVTVGKGQTSEVTATAAQATTAVKKEKSEVSKAETQKVAPGLVDLNSATQKELEGIEGVGPATAKKIIAGRPYKSVDELSKAGLSKKKIEEIKPFVTVGQTPAATVTKKTASTEGTEDLDEKAGGAKEVTKSAAEKLAPGTKININTADKVTLEKLPRVGPIKAQAIIDGRPYGTIEDIMKVKGIKQKTFDAIKDYIVVK